MSGGVAAADVLEIPQKGERGARVTGEPRKAPGSAKVTFSLGLQRPESSAEKALRAVATPGSDSYRRFPGRKRIASQYGATPEAVEAVRKSAEKAGLTFRLDRTGVFARVTGKAAKMSAWLGKPVDVLEATRGGLRATFYGSDGRVPKKIRRYVPEAVLLDVQVAAPRATVAYAGKNLGTPRSCLPGASPQTSEYTYSYSQLINAYGVDALPWSPKIGKRTHLSVVAQGDGFSRSALRSSALCFGLPEMSFKRVPVPGLSTALPVGDEGNLDVQVVQAVLAADSRVSVIEAASFDLRDHLTWATVYAQKSLPDAATTSYGFCERQLRSLPPGALELTQSVLLRLGLAGTTVMAASGDRGSSDCVNNATGKGPRRKAVGYPGTSPYVLAIGGSRIDLTPENTRSSEVVWNATKLGAPLGPQDTAGGGGVSRIFDRPWWQDSRTKTSGRVVPDISAHSAGAPGWPLISLDDKGQPIVAPVGGTSAASPFVAATVALIAAKQKRPFGLIAPTLYALPQSALLDITKGTNDLFGQGCCQAKVGFDKASGLGAPKFERWLQDLPAPGS
jgi:subtilase family serine protease